MKMLLIKCGITFLRFIYFFIKLFTISNKKVTFISRQNSGYSLDIDLLNKQLHEDYAGIKTVILYKKIDNSLLGMISYGFHILNQMYHIATSRVVVLDGYCIAISVLRHKKTLTVIQMWHALGSLKKFGFSILDEEEGRTKEISKALHMHENYDYILTTSEISKGYFREAFNAKMEQMLVLGLPRMDFLQSAEAKKIIRDRFKHIYPECSNGKQIILYGPTHRVNQEVDVNSVVSNTDLTKFNLFIKLHDGTEIIYVDDKIIERGNNFYGIEALHLADFFISDYSAMIYEASLVKLPIYLYIYDYDTYMKNRGTYIDFLSELPGFMSQDMKKISSAIIGGDYDYSKDLAFLKKYITFYEKNITKELSRFIFDKLSA